MLTTSETNHNHKRLGVTDMKQDLELSDTQAEFSSSLPPINLAFDSSSSLENTSQGFKTVDHAANLIQPPLTPHKTVCFHSISGQPGSERKITSALDCLQIMINGTTLIKVKASMRSYRRHYLLEEDLTMIRWLPSTKKTSKARLPVKSIREVRPGKNTEVLKNQDITGMYSEDCTFSIIYGDEYESIDLIALSPEEANIWVCGLNFVIGLIKSPDSLEGREKMREKWLESLFETESEGKGLLDEIGTIALMRRITSDRLCTKSLKQKIAEFEMGKKNGEQRGCISKHAFISLFTQTATRPDIYFILVRYCGRDYMTAEEFQLFLEGEQGIMGTSLYQCQEMIKRFEPSIEARNNKQLLIDGFTQFMMSEACDLAGRKHVYQNMDKPFAHYFIAASHNTYLIEDQIRGPSSCEGYINALNSGCRCVKIDTHDSPDGVPMVYHGNFVNLTSTSKILFSEVLATIRENAFIRSPYPVIIILENHCSVKLQFELAQIIKQIFGDILFTPEMISDLDLQFDSFTDIDSNLSGEEIKPVSLSFLSNSSNDDHYNIKSQNLWKYLSPSRLLNRILIFVSDEIYDSEEESQTEKKVPFCLELAKLICFTSTKTCKNKNFNEVFSISEKMANKLNSSSTGEELIQRNKHRMTRVSPDISRIDSSNLNPLDFWCCGVQLISMNYQTNGQIMDLYRGFFSQNGGCGYVLKPEFLREKYSTKNIARRKDGTLGIDPLNIRIKIISGHHLPRPKGASLKASSIDPYVMVQCLGVPSDCGEARTRTVSSDGHNPIFDESFEFNITVPELALIRFLVLDDDFINDDFIGQLTIPVDCLQQGFKHVRLENMNGTSCNGNLFVKISITHRYESKQKLRRKRSWPQKNYYDTKQVGIKNIDDQLRTVFVNVQEAVQMRKNVEKSILDLCDECSLNESANMAQCLRIITLRLASCTTVVKFKIKKIDSGRPHIKVVGELTPKLSRMTATLDRTFAEFHQVCTNAPAFIESLTEFYKQFGNSQYEYHANHEFNSRSGYASCEEDFSSNSSGGKDSENFPFNNGANGLKQTKHFTLSITNISRHVSSASTTSSEKTLHKASNEAASSASSSPIGSLKSSNRKGEKVTEHLNWNLTVIKAELDCLHAILCDCLSAFQQIDRISESLEHIFEREHKLNLRSNSMLVRELGNMAIISNQQQQFPQPHQQPQQQQKAPQQFKQQIIAKANISSECENKLAPLSPASTDVQLRGILKKSTSPTPTFHNRGGSYAHPVFDDYFEWNDEIQTHGPNNKNFSDFEKLEKEK